MVRTRFRQSIAPMACCHVCITIGPRRPIGTGTELGHNYMGIPPHRNRDWRRRRVVVVTVHISICISICQAVAVLCCMPALMQIHKPAQMQTHMPQHMPRHICINRQSRRRLWGLPSCDCTSLHHSTPLAYAAPTRALRECVHAAVRCGAVRCGAVQCSAVRCGAVRCGAVRCGAV